jgi:HEAT repeat protein
MNRIASAYPYTVMTYQQLASFLLLMAVACGLAADQTTPTATSKVTEAREALKSLMGESNPQKRELAIRAMGILGNDAPTADILINTLRLDKDSKVRVAATAAISEGKCRAAMPALKEVLEDNDVVVAFASAKALWDLGDPSGIGLFQEVLAGERKGSQGAVKGALADAHRKLHEPNQLALLGVNETAGILFGPAGAALSFIEKGGKGGAAGRVVAATVLGQDKSDVSREVLESVLLDKNASVTAAVCKALALRGSKVSLPKIEPLVEDTRDPVRAMASAAVIRLMNRKP